MEHLGNCHSEWSLLSQGMFAFSMVGLSGALAFLKNLLGGWFRKKPDLEAEQREEDWRHYFDREEDQTG